MLDTLLKIILKGAIHGFSKTSIKTELKKNNKVLCLIESGLSHRFNLDKKELIKMIQDL